MEMNNILTILRRINNQSNEDVNLNELVKESHSILLSETFDEALNSIIEVNNNNKKDLRNAYLNFALQYGIMLTSIGINNSPILLNHFNEKLARTDDKVVQNLLKGVLKWIIPTDELNNVISSIQKKEGFTFDEESAYKRLFVYIGIKIQGVIIENLRINFPLSLKQSEMEFIVKVMFNVKRRKQKSDELDEFLALMKSTIEPELEKMYGTPKSIMTFYQNMISRQIDDILIPIYTDCLIELEPKIVIRDKKKILYEKNKLRLAYPLFDLILKNKKWEKTTYLFGKNKGKLDYRRQDQNLRKFIYKK